MPRDLDALLAFIARRQSTPYAWGRRRNDCVSFMSYAVKAQTGHHWLGKLSWSTKAGALRVLAREGGMEAALDRRYRRIPPAQAMRGDIAGVPDPDLGIHPAIVEGDTLVMPGTRGLRRLPRSAMTCAWSAVAPYPARQ